MPFSNHDLTSQRFDSESSTTSLLSAASSDVVHPAVRNIATLPKLEHPSKGMAQSSKSTVLESSVSLYSVSLSSMSSQYSGCVSLRTLSTVGACRLSVNTPRVSVIAHAISQRLCHPSYYLTQQNVVNSEAMRNEASLSRQPVAAENSVGEPSNTTLRFSTAILQGNRHPSLIDNYSKQRNIGLFFQDKTSSSEEMGTFSMCSSSDLK